MKIQLIHEGRTVTEFTGLSSDPFSEGLKIILCIRPLKKYEVNSLGRRPGPKGEAVKLLNDEMYIKYNGKEVLLTDRSVSVDANVLTPPEVTIKYNIQ